MQFVNSFNSKSDLNGSFKFGSIRFESADQFSSTDTNQSTYSENGRIIMENSIQQIQKKSEQLGINITPIINKIQLDMLKCNEDIFDMNYSSKTQKNTNHVFNNNDSIDISEDDDFIDDDDDDDFDFNYNNDNLFETLREEDELDIWKEDLFIDLKNEISQIEKEFKSFSNTNFENGKFNIRVYSTKILNEEFKQLVFDLGILKYNRSYIETELMNSTHLFIAEYYNNNFFKKKSYVNIYGERVLPLAIALVDINENINFGQLLLLIMNKESTCIKKELMKSICELMKNSNKKYLMTFSDFNRSNIKDLIDFGFEEQKVSDQDILYLINYGLTVPFYDSKGIKKIYSLFKKNM